MTEAYSLGSWGPFVSRIGGARMPANVLSCGSCGIDLRENAKFCDACGASTSDPVEAAEYKQVTVLFADVVRSMAIAAALDAERYREVMTDLAERSAAAAQRYGGTVEYTGDGVMALFGAPVALEDHAFRACLAALDIQSEVGELADEVHSRDGLTLRLRVGLNSGRVIAGEIGSQSLGYAAIGEHVGLAQRMESVAPSGGVMLSESTARLVEHIATLGEPEMVSIKGATTPVPARRLVGIRPRGVRARRSEAGLIGRRWEMDALTAMLDRAIGSRGCVVNVVGPPGIGKSRVAREAAELASRRGVPVAWTFCESHRREIPFGVMGQLLRAAIGVADVDADATRAHVRAEMPNADPKDLLLLDDLLDITEPKVSPPQMDPDARRRQLTRLIQAMTLARTTPVLYIVEDAHWIDAISESMLADLLSVIPRTPSMVLITRRPEYAGILTPMHDAQTIALAPLGDPDITLLLRELLGSHRSVTGLTTLIAERAAGNPFFAEEMVRELAQRGVLAGDHGAYVCKADIADVSVPATVQAAIEARIDLLSTPAKRTLYAASVIGARFEAGLLTAVEIDPVVEELLESELVDQVRFTPAAEYAFRHPLIRAVAYESQLKSDRAEWHRRLATAIEQRAPEAVEENASLIAEHLQAAGDLQAAYTWHMRAATWATNRDVAAARMSWGRACGIADGIPGDDPDRITMCIAPRTMLCATDFHAQTVAESQGRFAELRELCTAAGDKVSLAIGMTGLATEHLFAGRPRESSRLVAEQIALLESIGDPTLSLGLAFVPLITWFDTGEVDEMLRWSQIIIDLADGDPVKGAGFGIASPLAFALAIRSVARWWLSRPGWRQDLQNATVMAKDTDPATFALVIAWTHGVPITYGVLRADDIALRTVDEVVQVAQKAGNDYEVSLTEFASALVLLHQETATDRARGLELMAKVRDALRERTPSLVVVAELLSSLERARLGEADSAIAEARDAVEGLYQAGRVGYLIFGASVLVEMLLQRNADGDVRAAEGEIARLSDLLAGRAWVMGEITLLRLRTLTARVRGDDNAFRELAQRYRLLAESLGFDGHIAWAKALTEGCPS